MENIFFTSHKSLIIDLFRHVEKRKLLRLFFFNNIKEKIIDRKLLKSVSLTFSGFSNKSPQSSKIAFTVSFFLDIIE